MSSLTRWPLEYVPYQDLHGRPSIVVDGSGAEGTVLTLSHWPNSPCPPGLEADLSAQMAFAYLGRFDMHEGVTAVSNNHFDQDGLVSLLSLVHPEEALVRRKMLIDVARAGDFATYTNRKAARVSMVLSAFADPARSPLGPSPDDYAEWSTVLYKELLPRLTDICERTGDYRAMWANEDASLDASEEAINSGRVVIEEDPGLDLAVVHVPEDAPKSSGHLFAGQWRMGAPDGASQCHGAIHHADPHRTALRALLPLRVLAWLIGTGPRARVDLSPLTEQMNTLEEAARWVADAASGLTPGLRIDGTHESAVAPERFVEIVKAHLASAPPAWDPYITPSATAGGGTGETVET